jgi:hypothetical protein
MKHLLPLAAAFACLSALSGRAAEGALQTPPAERVETRPGTHPARKTAVFIQNSAGDELNARLPAFESRIVARAAGKDLSFISRADVLQALKQYPVDRAGAPDRNALGTAADRLLSDNSSAIRLAQNMGADALLVATVDSFASQTRTFKDPSLDLAVKNTTYNLRTSYKLLDGNTGGTLAGESFTSSQVVRQTETVQTDPGDVLNGLLDDAAGRIARSLQGRELPPLERRGGSVTISIAAVPKDVQGKEIGLPDLRVGDDGKLWNAGLVPVTVVATLEIDGVAAGSTPATLKVAPGLHKLRATRPGMETVELTINAAEGLALNLPMAMTAEGYARWREQVDYVWKLQQEATLTAQAIDKDRKLTDAALERQRALTPGELEVLKGRAEMLRNSGYRIDYRVNTKEAPKVKVQRSLYSLD